VNTPQTYKFQLRKVKCEDALETARLSIQLGYPSSAFQISQRLKKIQKAKNHVVYVAAIKEGKIIGLIHAFLCSQVASETKALIGGLVVDERCRFTGVGRRLVAKAEEWAAKKGCSILRVRSNIIRRETQPFYEDPGFKRIKTQHIYQKKL
jgi:GNAT superfamily N-acetyltransferase